VKKKPNKWSAALGQRRTQIALFVVTWAALFLFGAWPAWRTCVDNEGRIENRSLRLETLHEWAVAGSWLAEAVRRWEEPLGEDYDRYFPPRKQREELLLELAHVASLCRIDPIELREVPIPELIGAEEEDRWELTPEEEERAQLIQEFAPNLRGLPGTRLLPYRVRATFQSDYNQLARFLQGLETIPRALTLHELRAQQGVDVVMVEMELDFYAQFNTH
jgi:hypothetical protein